MSEEIIAELQSKNKHLSDLLENQDKEVESLRELLKECKANLIHRKLLLEKLEELENPTISLVTRINAAIGESEE